MLACNGVSNRGLQKLVGRSHECDFPKEFVREVPVLTRQKTQFDENSSNPAKDIDEQVRKALSSGNGLYELDTALLGELNPDIILTQDLCEVCSIDVVLVERIVKRMKVPAKVVNLNPQELGEVIDCLQQVGDAVGCEEGALKLIDELNQRISAVTQRSLNQKPRPNVAFLEWTDPLFVGGHWTPEIINLAGGDHPLNGTGMRSHVVSEEAVAESNPDIIIIAPCGMSLSTTRTLIENVRSDPKRKHWFDSLSAVANGRCVLVDGNEMFNRPGPRLIYALEFCSDLIGSYLSGSARFDKNSVGNKEFPWEPL